MTSDAGIYAICNTHTGEAYIGRSVGIAFRWKAHIQGLKSGRHANVALQLAWDRDGASSFQLVVLERLADSTNGSGVGKSRQVTGQFIGMVLLETQERRWLVRARAAGIVLYNDQVRRGRKVAT